MPFHGDYRVAALFLGTTGATGNRDFHCTMRPQRYNLEGQERSIYMSQTHGGTDERSDQYVHEATQCNVAQEHVQTEISFLVPLSGAVLRDGCIWDTFASERKHKTSKCYAEAVTNFRCFDKSVNLRTLLENRRQLQEFRVNSCLMGATCMAPSLAREIGQSSVEVAHKLDWHGVIFNVGDVLLYRGSFFCVQACLDYGSLGLLCSMFSVAGIKSPASTILREVEGEQALLDLAACDQIVAAHAWCIKEDGSWLVLHPRC